MFNGSVIITHPLISTLLTLLSTYLLLIVTSVWLLMRKRLQERVKD